MRALLFHCIVFTTVALAACAGQSDHKIGITHKLPNQQDLGAGNSAKAQALLDASKNNKCLDVSQISAELTKDATIYSVYTSDLDLGQLKSVSGNSEKCVEFTSNADETSRALTFFKSSNDLRPQLETLTGTDLTGSSSVGAFLSVSGQDKCSSVALLKGAFSVLCKSARQITLQGTINGAQAIVKYSLNPKNLVITSYTLMPASPHCKTTLADGSYVKRTSIVSWSGAADKMRMSRPLAQLFQTYLVTKPAELTSAVANPTAKTDVLLSTQTYTYMINMLSLDKKLEARLTCN